MGNNVGPWTKEALGFSMTPAEFLANPEAQDAVFQFKFGQYVNKYGPEGAARAWFAGERGMNNPNAKDVLGTTVAAYGAKFMRGLGQAPQVPQPPAMVPQGTGTDIPAYAWSRPEVPPQREAEAFDQSLMAQAPFAAPPPINYYQRRGQPALYQPPIRRNFSLRG